MDYGLLSPEPVYDQAIFVLGGAYQAGGFADNFQPWKLTHNDDVLLGGGYQYFPMTDPDGFSFGFEAGAVGRLSRGELSAEMWGGVVGRYDGFVIADTVRVSPALTFGLSYVTGKVSSERTQEQLTGESADLLFYVGPEINFSLADSPDMEAFVRLQHRSGAWGTLAHMDGANASTVGVRKRF